MHDEWYGNATAMPKLLVLRLQNMKTRYKTLYPMFKTALGNLAVENFVVGNFAVENFVVGNFAVGIFSVSKVRLKEISP